MKELIDGVVSGRFGAAVGALTITRGREARLDFTHLFFTTGFAIAVPAKPSSPWSTLARIVSWRFVDAIGLLLCLLAGVGLLFWLVERRGNEGQFGGNPLKGIGSGIWFTAVTMTTVGYGDKTPLAGRIIALVSMFTGVIIISTFTGMIASSLTADRLSGSVAGPDDLPEVAVGSISGTASDEWLSSNGVTFKNLDSVAAGLKAVAPGKIDAFVYDTPLLRYLVNEYFQGSVNILPRTFGRQDYGIALPQGSPLREPVNRALLRYIESETWSDALVRAIGKKG